ncbi:MAG: glycosyltransferase family 8 protein [Clostridia bacterium]|nr:glycosyltransferase family 8 protein [Clostridia bacterium]
MNILYCGDGNISDGLTISVLSLIKNVKQPLCIYVLTMSYMEKAALSEEFADFLDRRVKSVNNESFVKLFDITNLFESEQPNANKDTRFTPFCMLRLFADEIKEIPDKILYLDCDVICRKDFSKMYNIDLADNELAGVLDYYGRWFFKKNPFKFDYLNSGVLLLNMKRIRKTGLFSKCRKLCRNKKMFMPDQSAINKLSIGKRILPRKYNEQRKLKEETVFQHFTTSFRFFPYIRSVTVKPWQQDKLHNVLGIYEYDGLLKEQRILKEEFANERKVTL